MSPPGNCSISFISAPFSSAPFGGIAFPNYLPEMSTTSHYHAPTHTNSMLPPPNATSPPVALGGPYMAPRTGGRNFVENTMYNTIPQSESLHFIC